MSKIKVKEYVDSLAVSAQAVVDGEKLKKKRILVTGATGLIGSAIVDTLLYMNETMGYDMTVLAAGRTLSKLEKRFGEQKNGLEYIRYDAGQTFEEIKGADYVIHCASNAHPAAYVRYPVETMTANINGTLQLLEYIRRNRRGRLVFVSSSEVYGEKKNTNLYVESDSFYLDYLNPRACYPAGKRAAEALCSCYLEEYQVDSVIVRPGHIYGPTMTGEDSRAYAQFARNVLDHQDIIMKSDGEQLRSYCYVMDCVSAILSVMVSGKSGEAYNISNRDSVVTIRQLAQAFAEKSGRKICFQIPEDREKKGYNLMSCSALNSEKLESLGWKGQYNLQEGVSSMLKIMTAQRENG